MDSLKPRLKGLFGFSVKFHSEEKLYFLFTSRSGPERVYSMLGDLRFAS